ncbi:MAG: hypothetical protein R2788_14455 [Saprospiraceae bacterium]
MNAQQVNAWMMSGGGLKLWEELYSDFGLLPIPGGNTGFQIGRLVQQRNQFDGRFCWAENEDAWLALFTKLAVRQFYWLVANYLPGWNAASSMQRNGSALTTIT